MCIEMLGTKVNLPVPREFQTLLAFKGVKPDPKTGHVQLNDLLRVAADNPDKMRVYRDKVGDGVQAALAEQFKKYDLRGKTWADLTKSTEERAGQGAEARQAGQGRTAGEGCG